MSALAPAADGLGRYQALTRVVHRPPRMGSGLPLVPAGRYRCAVRIYISGPLFSEAERAWLDNLAVRLRAEGFDCFVPHENSIELNDPTPGEVFRVDAAGVRNANVLLAWLDGPVVDDGTACEIGLFAELVAGGDPRYRGIVGLVTDLRLQQRRGNTVGDGMNLFVIGAIEASGRVCWSVDEAVDALRELAAAGTRRPLDRARGAEVAKSLRAFGVKGGPLIKAAELGYITELRCAMPRCFCPEELGGAGWFAPRSRTWDDWEPTHEHFPIPKRDGGKATPDNTILAHRICNKLDYSIFDGQPIGKLLARIEAARVAAAAANLPQSAPAAEAVAEVSPTEHASPAKSSRKRKPPAWKSLPPTELAAHLLATPTIADPNWTTEKRLPRENRESFIRRILLGETPESTSEETTA